MGVKVPTYYPLYKKMTKLTQKTLEAFRPKDDGQNVRDDGGLFGRVRAKADGSVTVSFYYRFRLNDRVKDFSCGSWPINSLAAIRSERDRARLLVTDGIDPGAQKKITRHETQNLIAEKIAVIEQAKVQNLNVNDLFEKWLSDGVRRKDGNAELRRSFDADVLPKIGKIAIKDLTEHDVRGVLKNLVKRGVNRATVVLRNNLTQMFAWAEKRQPWRKLLIDGNPVDLIEIEKIVDRSYDMRNERTRKLSAEEIKELQGIFDREQFEFDNAVNKRSTPRPVESGLQCAIWIMLSTLCRVGELSMARWENVDFQSRVWFIPKENTKGEENDFTIFLSDFALEHFQNLKRVSGKTDWLFPAKHHDGHVCTKSMSKRVGDRQSMFKKDAEGGARKPMSNRRHDNTFVLGEGKEGAWTPHDLRRTGATMMQSLGVPLDIIDRCQNHVLGGSKVRRHYLQHDYADEKRNAWQVLGNRLSLILNPADNVIILPRSA